jgi:hypothetical protein
MRAREERKELENILDKSPKENINKNIPTEGDEIPGLHAEPVTDVNFLELKQLCDKEAEIMLKNAITFIIPKDMLENNEYIQDKLKVDIMSLSGMIYQMRTNEVMQKALIDQVNLGMVNARMFEVFSGMSKTIGDLNKQLIQTVEAIKETYKKFKDDVKEQRTEALGPQYNSSSGGMLTTGDGGVVTRGTKEMINNVKRLKTSQNDSEEYIDDAELIPDIDKIEKDKL